MRPHRLGVRTPAFQAENRGSIPRGATNFSMQTPCALKFSVYKLALEYARADEDLLISLDLPKNSRLVNQLSCASLSIPLNIAEDAGRYSKADKNNPHLFCGLELDYLWFLIWLKKFWWVRSIEYNDGVVHVDSLLGIN